jgi:hypothetical protein
MGNGLFGPTKKILLVILTMERNNKITRRVIQGWFKRWKMDLLVSGYKRNGVI